jgi:hypothetical protein
MSVFNSVINYESIKDNLELNYINNLIKTCEKNNINKDILLKILEKKNKSISDTSETKRMSLDINATKINQDSPLNSFSDDYLYQKPWTKLTAIHKIIKIKEFITSLEIKDEKERLEIKEKLIELVKNKILTKKDSVIYDPIKAKIISIQSLQFKEGKYII